jgi:ribosome-binding factor A
LPRNPLHTLAATGDRLVTASGGRKRRVDEAIRQVLSDALPGLKDPRIGFVTVTGVEATRDFSQATVYVSVYGSELERQKTLEGLAAASGVLQAQVARELRLRRTPVLSFAYDPAVERGVRLGKMIDELAPEEPGDERERDPDE